ncbi:hypothetical protein V8C86DRAFT_1271177 [Haematococcus lacustris]
MAGPLYDSKGYRFEPPAACLIAAPAGKPAVYGIPERPTRRISQHSFEATKALQNAQAEAAAMSTPCGPRFAAAQEYNAQKARAKEEYDDWQRPNKPAFPETLTSVEHPLRTAANDASALPFYTTRGIPAHYTDVQVPAGKRTYPRDERYGTTSHLDATLSPRTGTELLAARHEASILRSSVTAQAAQVAEALAQLRAQGTLA